MTTPLDTILSRHNLAGLDLDLHDNGHFPHLSVKALLQSMWDFSTLAPAPGVRASDIDFVLERKGRFLVLEFKSTHVDDPLPTGQGRLLRAFADLSPKVTLYVVNGPPGRPTHVRRLAHQGPLGAPQEIDLDGLRALIVGWWHEGV